MAKNTTELFSSLGLDVLEDMDPAEVQLYVPLRDGVIQLESPDYHTPEKLLVIRETIGNILVKFEDKRQLQAEFLARRMIDGTLQTVRVPVFESPIDQVEFHKTEGMPSAAHWVASAHDLSVPDTRVMRDFVDYIGLYAAHKQKANEIRAKYDSENS